MKKIGIIMSIIILTGVFIYTMSFVSAKNTCTGVRVYECTALQRKQAAAELAAQQLAAQQAAAALAAQQAATQQAQQQATQQQNAAQIAAQQQAAAKVNVRTRAS